VAGRITFANERFCEISGYTRDELLGQNHRILKSGEHPEEFYREMWRTLVQGLIWHGEICNRAKDGGRYWVRATITPFLDERGKPEEYVAIRTDITEQKMLEAGSRQQEARFRGILDNLGEGVYTLDAEGRLTYLNREGERLLGWSLAELKSRSLHQAIHHHHPDGRPMPAQLCPIRQAMEENLVYRSGEEIFFRRDSSMLPVKITGAPLIADGMRLGSVAVFSDASEERLLQQRLLDAKNAAEAAARVKSEFLSTMSHEIRTPLNGVIGMTGLLLETRLDSEQTEFARLIKTSADALMAIVGDILDFSKIEAGRLEIETTDFSLRQTVESTLDVVAGKAQEKDLLLASLIAPELPDHLVGDPTRLRQILLNFLSNAVKFTARGEVMVAVTSVAGEPLRVIAADFASPSATPASVLANPKSPACSIPLPNPTVRPPGAMAAPGSDFRSASVWPRRWMAWLGSTANPEPVPRSGSNCRWPAPRKSAPCRRRTGCCRAAK
jgi:two-component system sensor histidine kinase/response regulator